MTGIENKKQYDLTLKRVADIKTHLTEKEQQLKENYTNEQVEYILAGERCFLEQLEDELKEFNLLQ